jgi:hypothetical protein
MHRFTPELRMAARLPQESAGAHVGPDNDSDPLTGSSDAPEALPEPAESLPALVLNALQDGPCAGHVLAARLSRRWATVFRVLNGLIIEGMVERIGRGRSTRWRASGGRGSSGWNA